MKRTMTDPQLLLTHYLWCGTRAKARLCPTGFDSLSLCVMGRRMPSAEWIFGARTVKE